MNIHVCMYMYISRIIYMSRYMEFAEIVFKNSYKTAYLYIYINTHT